MRIDGLTERVRNDAAVTERAAVTRALAALERAAAPYEDAFELRATDVATYERVVREVHADAALDAAVATLPADVLANANRVLAENVRALVAADAQIGPYVRADGPFHEYFDDAITRYQFTAAALPSAVYTGLRRYLPAPQCTDAASARRLGVMRAYAIQDLADAVLSELRRAHWADADDVYVRIARLPYVLAMTQVRASVEGAREALATFVVPDVIERGCVFDVAAAELPLVVPVRVEGAATFRVRKLADAAAADMRAPVRDGTELEFDEPGTYEFTVFNDAGEQAGGVVFTVRVRAFCVRHGGEYDVGTARRDGECEWTAHPLTEAEVAYRARPEFARLRAHFGYTPALVPAYSEALDRTRYSPAELEALAVRPPDERRRAMHTYTALVERHAAAPVDDAAVLTRLRAFTATPYAALAELRRREALGVAPLLLEALGLLAAPTLHHTERTFVNAVLMRLAREANTRDPEATFWDADRAAYEFGDALVDAKAERRLDARIAAVMAAYGGAGRAMRATHWSGVHSSDDTQPDRCGADRPGSLRVGVGVSADEVRDFLAAHDSNERACMIVDGVARFAPPGAFVDLDVLYADV